MMWLIEKRNYFFFFFKLKKEMTMFGWAHGTWWGEPQPLSVNPHIFTEGRSCVVIDLES